MKRETPITLEKRKGVKVLLEWAIDKYQNATSNNGKRMWKKRIDFLADLQRKQTYGSFDKNTFNLFREEYYNERK